ncbi:MAG: helix-turn-helix domain-containing protein [Actinobacteria bacterium]|nr:helix-turn-helix domain-containing protein [Actinomycetota bacterium]
MADESITLNEAAESLGVHYMTAYRYVRTGRLAAVKVGGEWRVSTEDLEAFRSAASAPAPTGRTPRADYHQRLEDRLLVGDENGAWSIIESALSSGTEPREIYLQVLAPALQHIGDEWADGRVTVAEEHRASVVTQRIIGRLGPRFNRPGRKRGTIVIGAPQGDHHSVPSAMASDLLRGQGFEVIDLGANTPAQSFLDALRSVDDLVAAGLCATRSDNEAAIEDTIELIHTDIGCSVVLGGGAIGPDTRSCGADVVSLDAAGMLAAFEDLSVKHLRTRS